MVSETLAGLERLRSGLGIEEMEALDSRARFQNPKSISSSPPLLQLDEVVLFKGLILRDRSGCAGNNSILFFTFSSLISLRQNNSLVWIWNCLLRN